MSFDPKNRAAQLAATAMMIFGGAAAAQEPAAPVKLAQVQVQSLPSYQGAGGVSVTAQGGTANAPVQVPAPPRDPYTGQIILPKRAPEAPGTQEGGRKERLSCLKKGSIVQGCDLVRQ